MQRILLATDGSPHSEAALDVGAALAGATGAEIVVAHVAGDHHPDEATRHGIEVEFAAEIAERERVGRRPPAGSVSGETAPAGREHEHVIGTLLGERVLERAANGLRERGVAGVTTRLIEDGEPAERILELAERDGCDTIVMGCRGQGRLGELVLGSVSRSVAHRADRRVVMVR